jgi:hypothetical protein
MGDEFPVPRLELLDLEQTYFCHGPSVDSNIEV